MEALLRGLAASRLARLLNEDYIAEPVRDWMKGSGNRHLEYLAECPACASIWGGLIALVLPMPLVRVLAFSEGAVLARELVDALQPTSEVWGR